MSNITDRVLRNAFALQKRYDPENDIVPGAPKLLYSENQLLDMIKDLVTAVNDLQYQVDKFQDLQFKR